MDEPIVQFEEHRDRNMHAKFQVFVQLHSPLFWIVIILISLHPILLIWTDIPVWFSMFALSLNVAWVYISFRLSAFPRNDWTVQFATTVQFYDDKFVSYTQRRGHTIHRTMNYELIAKVFERDSAFYVRYTCGRFDCFSKVFMCDEQAAALRELFARKFGEKFKSIQNNNPKG